MMPLTVDINATPVTIAVLAGDGVGPEVTAAARAVLEAVGSRFHIAFTFVDALIGGAAIDATGTALPVETVSVCERADAILLGAVGGPQWDSTSSTVRPEQGLLGIRRALGLFANIRPVRCRTSTSTRSPFRADHLAGVDFVVVRELTGGIYFGERRREPTPAGVRATDVCTYDTQEIERIVRVAASLAQRRAGRLVSVDKANVLETSRLWRETATRIVGHAFPDIALTHMLVDTCAMQIIQNPRSFDVIVTENMFGDILTDEAAVLAGSIGLLPSASLGVATASKTPGLYEPIHGSAPDIAGKGVANPIGAILSSAMLLRHSLGREAEALAVEQAVEQILDAGLFTTDLCYAGAAAATTEQVTAAVVDAIVS